MRSRASALVTVVSFALVVALAAVLASQGDKEGLVKLPAGSAGYAADEASAAGTSVARSAAPFPGGGVTYRFAGDMPDLAMTAPGYRLGSITTEAAVARLAAALGLPGDVRSDDDGWVVDGGDRELRVARTAGLPWFVSAGCPDSTVSPEGESEVSCAVAVDLAVPTSGGGSSAASSGSAAGCPADGCAATAVATAVAPAARPAPLRACEPGTQCVVEPAPPCVGDTVQCAPPACAAGAECTLAEPVSPPDCAPDAKCVTPPTAECAPDRGCALPEPKPLPEPPARPSGLPSEHDARVTAQEVFARLGVGTEHMVMEDAWSSWLARVDTVVDGTPVVGLGTWLNIGVKGQIVGGNGFLAVPERIGDYPLVGVAAGLRRLNAGAGFGGRSTGGGIAGGAPALDAPATTAVEKGEEPAATGCGDPTVICEPDAPVPVEPTVQVVTGVHLALLQIEDALVPAYAFELEGDGMVPVSAVTDEWLEAQAPVAGRD